MGPSFFVHMKLTTNTELPSHSFIKLDILWYIQNMFEVYGNIMSKSNEQQIFFF